MFVWGEYMPDVFLGMAMKNVWIYSFIYNLIYTAFNWLIAAIVIYFLSKRRSSCSPKSKNVFTHPLFFRAPPLRENRRGGFFVYKDRSRLLYLD